jgi:hypothetical protein
MYSGIAHSPAEYTSSEMLAMTYGLQDFEAMLDKYISFALFAVFLPLLLYGLSLAYYLPAIPFIRWISALAGWVILIVEPLLWLPALSLHTHCRKAKAPPDSTASAVICSCSASLSARRRDVILTNVLGRLIGAGFDQY